MRTMHGFLLLSLTTGVVLVACGRTPLSVGASVSGDGGAGGVTTTSTTGSVTTSVSVSVSTSVSVSVSASVSASASSTTGTGGGPACTPEICDGLDNNCDGVIDEGCLISACSDGTREGFIDAAAYPKIAGCSGGFSVPGIVGALAATCAFSAGNSGNNPAGVGCSAADLCSPGFHVCKSAGDVQASSPTGCVGAATSAGLFFATGQSSTGCNACALGVGLDPIACGDCSCGQNCQQTALVDNDLFGCGSVGDTVDTCGGLDRSSGNLCTSLGGSWNCSSPAGQGCDEASHVTKSASAGGGVLCCAN